MLTFMHKAHAPTYYPQCCLLNHSVARCHYERCKYQRSEVKCLGINSWRDNCRGAVWARTHHQGDVLNPECV